VTRPSGTTIRRAGLSLVELMLALAITGMIGVGIASTMTMVAAGARGERDGRSAVLRTHALSVRLHAYLDSALGVLQHDPDRGVVVWLHDPGGEGAVHLTEIRVIWWEADAGRLRVERVDLPDSWPATLRATYDAPVPADSDFFNTMLAQREAGVASVQTVMEGVESFSASFNHTDVQRATRMDLAVGEEVESLGVLQTLLTFGFAEHRRPTQ